jgi:hypothetical protein
MSIRGLFFVQESDKDNAADIGVSGKYRSSVDPMFNYESSHDDVATNVGEPICIADVFEQNGLNDLTKSIYKVDEFRKTLPTSLPLDIAKQSILGIISVSGLDVESLKQDARNRIDVLMKAKDMCTVKTAEIVSGNEDKINGLLAEVEKLKNEISDRQEYQQHVEEFVFKEIDTINKINTIIS